MYCQIIYLTQNYMKILDKIVPMSRLVIFKKIKIALQQYLLIKIQHAIVVEKRVTLLHILPRDNQLLRINVIWIEPCTPCKATVMIQELVLEIPMTRLLLNPFRAAVKQEKDTKTTDMVSRPMYSAVFKKLKWDKKKKWWINRWK